MHAKFIKEFYKFNTNFFLAVSSNHALRFKFNKMALKEWGDKQEGFRTFSHVLATHHFPVPSLCWAGEAHRRENKEIYVMTKLATREVLKN